MSTMTYVSPTELIDIFEQSKTALTSQGWGKDRLICDDGRVCAMGALEIALGAKVEFREDEYGTFHYFTYPWDSLPEDDYDARTKAEYAWDDRAIAASNALRRGLWSVIGAEENYGVEDWNDLQAESMQDVLSVFDAAIELQRAEA